MGLLRTGNVNEQMNGNSQEIKIKLNGKIEKEESTGTGKTRNLVRRS